MTSIPAFFCVAGLLASGTGFILLFGPDYSSTPSRRDKRNNLGALLYFGGIGILVIGALSAATLFPLG